MAGEQLLLHIDRTVAKVVTIDDDDAAVVLIDIGGGKKQNFGGRQVRKKVRSIWRDNSASQEVPPASCFFVLKGTEPKKKSSKQENGQKISAYGHALTCIPRGMPVPMSTTASPPPFHLSFHPRGTGYVHLWYVHNSGYSYLFLRFRCLRGVSSLRVNINTNS